jgi:GT2 family glycosyltransferase
VIENKHSIAVLITINNRYKETKKCLLKLNSQINLFDEYELDVYISDSSKNNLEFQDNLRNLNIIYFKIRFEKYWNLGMIESWRQASKDKKHDFFVWLNNDTYLYDFAIEQILEDYHTLNKNSIIVGSTEFKNKITYGGRNFLNASCLYPKGFPIKINFMNGNIVLIPNVVFQKLGFLNDQFTHSLGDIDYGLRARKKNIDVYLCSKIIAECMSNELEWYEKKSFYKRVKFLNNPKSLPLKEYFYFNHTHFGLLKAVKFILGVVILVISPKIHNFLKTK